MAMADPTASRSRIFISYRHEDTEYPVGRLVEDLCGHFPADQVFQDFTSIDPGVDFVEAVQQGLSTCAALLVVIGPEWLSITDPKGRRRLDLPGDWVAHEVAESLRQPEVRVFPVLVDAEMPSAEDLPESLRPLTRRQAFPLTSRHWPNDVAQLIEFLKKVPGLAATRAPAKSEAGGAGPPPKPVAADPAPPVSRPQAQTPPRQGTTRAGLAGVSAPAKVPWKAPAAIVAGLGIAVVVFSLLRERPEPIPSTTPTATPAPAAATPKGGESFRDCEQCPEMVVIPAGKVLMGSPEREVGRSPTEGPQQEVAFARPFAVGKFEVTFDEWDACVAAGGCAHKPTDEGWGRGRQPVINVSWSDAQVYVSWLAKKTGKPYRLLSEAEWEYAARAGKTTRYPWGDEPGTNLANFDGSGSRWSGRRTAPVGSFEANAFGLHDMIGNVWEWVEDCWNESYGDAPLDGRAWESGDCGRRVLRGGSWGSKPEVARAAVRGRIEPGNRNYLGVGFRLARTL
jgi:formylglycine-generating enzyme required for sulfatase activity